MDFFFTCARGWMWPNWTRRWACFFVFFWEKSDYHNRANLERLNPREVTPCRHCLASLSALPPCSIFTPLSLPRHAPVPHARTQPTQPPPPCVKIHLTNVRCAIKRRRRNRASGRMGWGRGGWAVREEAGGGEVKRMWHLIFDFSLPI